jgi:transcription elongation factor GreA
MSEDIDNKKKIIKDEIDKLNYEFKVELPKKISEARAYGDLKENAEYHAARERQSFVKARISQLSDQLQKLGELDISTIPDDRIGYGSTVQVLDTDSEDNIEFTLVSQDAVDPSEGKISLSSPVGAALMNRTVGEEIEIAIPAGKRRYFIERVITIHGRELKAGKI